MKPIKASESMKYKKPALQQPALTFLAGNFTPAIRITGELKRLLAFYSPLAICCEWGNKLGEFSPSSS